MGHFKLTDGTPTTFRIAFGIIIMKTEEKKTEGKYKSGVPNGKWTYYYENGNIKSVGMLLGSLKEGHWTYYFESGDMKSAGSYEKDQKSGAWDHFYEDGSIKAQINYQNEIGEYREFYPYGGTKQEGKIVNDKSEREWIYYYETGETKAIGHFNEGLRTGLWHYYYRNGKEKAVGNYHEGQKNGEWRYFYENGSISQTGNIMRDRKQDYWKLFYPSGELKGEISFDNGSGIFREYYLNGSKKSEGRIVNDKKEGEWLYYDENGELEGEADFENSEGVYSGYYPDGNLKIKGKIKNDKRLGKWSLYNPDGSIAGTYTPIYEYEKPLFVNRLLSDPRNKPEEDGYNNPRYKYKKRGLRYFNPRINEYRALIVGTNPLWLLDKQLPIALEYYMQERIGYEVQLDIIKDPFFMTTANIPDYSVFSRGSRLNFRQKFYHENDKPGMFYFGHEISFTFINHQVDHPDTLIFPTLPKFGNMMENEFSYGFFVGTRWMRDVGDSGPTFDLFLGIRIANRTYKREFEPDPVLDIYFDPLVEPGIYFPLIFGLNIGLAVPDNKSKTQ